MRPLVTGFQQVTAFAVNVSINFVKVARQYITNIARAIWFARSDAFHIRAEALAKTAPCFGEKALGKDIRLVGTVSNRLPGSDFGGT